MDIFSLGDIVAERTFEKISSEGQPIGKVTVKIGRPVEVEIGRSYCPYQIQGMGEEKMRYAMGVDTIQALILALTKVGTDLYTSQEWKMRSLTWMGDSSGNLGIPVVTEALAESLSASTMNLTI